MNQDQMIELVKECGLDWHKGYMPLFDGDDTNRYAVLIEAVLAQQQQGEAVPTSESPTTGELIQAWSNGEKLQFLVLKGHDDEWTTYVNGKQPDFESKRLAWRVEW